jgi:ribosome-binding factor A
VSDSRRAERIAEAIRAEVATFLRDGAKDPRLVGFVTVTGVEMPRDLRRAVVYVSVMGTDTERTSTLEGLNSLAAHLRPRVGRALRLRLAPDLVFKLDESVQRAARIDTLLNQVRAESRSADDDRRDT